MEFIDNNDIENFTKDGAILCRGIFSEWVDELRIGVDKLIANPSVRERSYTPEDGTAPFFQDLVFVNSNWMFSRIRKATGRASSGSKSIITRRSPKATRSLNFGETSTVPLIFVSGSFLRASISSFG